MTFEGFPRVVSQPGTWERGSLNHSQGLDPSPQRNIKTEGGESLGMKLGMTHRLGKV